MVVGLRPDSSSVAKAEADGLEVLPIADAASRGDVVMILLPDEQQARDLGVGDRRRHRARATCCCSPTASRSTTTRSRPGPGVDVGMVAPKGPGHLVRRQFAEGNGVPGLIAIHQDESGTARDLDPGLRQGHRLHPRRA